MAVPHRQEKQIGLGSAGSVAVAPQKTPNGLEFWTTDEDDDQDDDHGPG